MPLILYPNDFDDYQLLDSGNEEKLEKVCGNLIIRPEPKAIWNKTLSKEIWENANAKHTRDSSGGGHWDKRNLPKESKLKWNNLVFSIKATDFKHLGIFPEQASLWKWIQDKITTSNKKKIKVLNLFGYTGGASIAALSAGAEVTHVDASREVITWANRNVELSGLKDKPVRWIVDDAVKFLTREVKRGNRYDAIIMDPPKFGRGAKGEIWKIEEDLSKLMNLCSEVLSNDPLFWILNVYTVSYTSSTLKNLLSQVMKDHKGKIDFGELGIKQKDSEIILATGIFARWESES